MKKSLLFLLLTVNVAFTFGQNKKPLNENWQDVFFDSSSKVIPLLINSAINHAPELEIFDLDKQNAVTDLELAKKEYLRNISLNSGYNYGNTNTVIGNQAGQPVPVYNPMAGRRSQSTYTVGLGVGINLEQLFGGRRLRLHKQELEIEQAEADKKQAEKQLRVQVITLYQNLVLARNLLRENQNAVQTAYVNKNLAEKQFKEGEIHIDSQMDANDLYTKAVLAKEQSSNNYKTALLLLEELIGTQISTLMSSQINK